ncbi:MAG: LacI family DNA-binding transcriptional regulator [Armatimonadaceae bacterium]
MLNNRQREGRSVAPAKQEEIWRVAREMGYQPNQAARNLVRGKTDTVALALQVPSPGELPPHYAEIIGALTITLKSFGLNLLLAQVDGDPNDTLRRLAQSRPCDGVLLTDMQVNDVRPALLRSLHMPFVIRGSAPSPGYLAVGMDNVAVGYRSMEFLHRLGHRRILFHNIGRSYMAGQRRWEGYCKALAQFHLESTVRYEDVLYGEEGMYQLVYELATHPNCPTAIFAADEMAASGAMQALSDAGKRVPQDVSILTCLNARFMRRLHPRLSVLNVRQDEVASEAGRTLARLLRGENMEPRQVFLSPILEESGSCAPPPSERVN